MRQLLLSTALVTIALAPAAQAEMEVTLSGYVEMEAALFDNDTPNNTTREMMTSSELKIVAKNTTESGLEYGAYLELQTSTSDDANVDEANIYLKTGWGKFEFGDQDGAGSELTVGAPYVGIGQVRGSYNKFVPAADRGYRISETGNDTFLKAIDTYDTTKVTYYTPKLSGFQAGISYAPENGSEGEAVVFSDTTSDHSDAVELGLNYKGEFSGVSLEAGGQYTLAEATDTSGLEDINAWSFGLQLGYEGFKVGGNYVDNGDSGLATGVADDDVSLYSLGVSYEKNDWGVALSYAQVDFDDNGVSFDNTGGTGSGGDYTAYGGGATYKIAPGLSVGADLVYFDRDRDVGADTDGYVLVTEARVAF